MREIMTRRASHALPPYEWEAVERQARRKLFAVLWMIVWGLAFMEAQARVAARYQAIAAVVGIAIAWAPSTAFHEGWRSYLRVTAVQLPAMLFAAWVFPLATPDWPWLVAMGAAYMAASLLSVRRQYAVWPVTIWSVAMIAICTWWYIVKL